jgi:hypothetical protein
MLTIYEMDRNGTSVNPDCRSNGINGDIFSFNALLGQMFCHLTVIKTLNIFEQHMGESENGVVAPHWVSFGKR